jgi:hypothetical protein
MCDPSQSVGTILPSQRSLVVRFGARDRDFPPLSPELARRNALAFEAPGHQNSQPFTGDLRAGRTRFYEEETTMKYTIAGISHGTIALAILILSTPWAQANEMYCYQGHDFTNVTGSYTSTEAASGCVTLSSALPTNSSLTNVGAEVLSFSFQDGLQTIAGTSAPSFDQFEFATSGGAVSGWCVNVNAGPSYISTSTAGGCVFQAEDAVDLNNGSSFAFVNNSPGTWTATAVVASTVPEPGSIALSATVIAVLGFAVGRKRSRRMPGRALRQP